MVEVTWAEIWIYALTIVITGGTVIIAIGTVILVYCKVKTYSWKLEERAKATKKKEKRQSEKNGF